MNPGRISALIAGASVVAVVAWSACHRPQPWPLSAPTCSTTTILVPLAVLPPLGDFDREFACDAGDPFLPYHARQIALDRRGHPRVAGDQAVVAAVPPRPEALIPPLVLPPAVAHPPTTPICFGVVASARGASVLVRMPGSDHARQVRVGDTVPEGSDPRRSWTLLAVDSGTACFRDPDGADQSFKVATGG
jgi:hypothetical protein